MALFRKKKQDVSKALPEKPSISSPQPTTPLYARFASSAPPPPSKVVSGPMMLQQRPSFSSRHNSDDSRRRAAPSNPNLRGDVSIRSAKVDKPLPPPGRPSPESETPPVFVHRSPSNAQIDTTTFHTVASPQPVQRLPSVYTPNGASNNPPPSSFSREGVSSKDLSARKSAATSLMSDIPDHMFNIHNLDLGDESDRETRKPAPAPSLPPGAAKPLVAPPSQGQALTSRQPQQPLAPSRLPTRIPQVCLYNLFKLIGLI
ncbi:hypothetical protein DL96DRAFT_1221247 [Flagelloscypha sp. PMI_526]|nr:hypothetical protein DL96DRAFT_1221247 [Flagelloscypha sp. PMI_526]